MLVGKRYFLVRQTKEDYLDEQAYIRNFKRQFSRLTRWDEESSFHFSDQGLDEL